MHHEHWPHTKDHQPQLEYWEGRKHWLHTKHCHQLQLPQCLHNNPWEGNRHMLRRNFSTYFKPNSKFNSSRQSVSFSCSLRFRRTIRRQRSTFSFRINPNIYEKLLKKKYGTTRLFNEEIRLSSNVSGRKKKQLDPRIIDFIRKKAFIFFLVLTWIHPKNGLNVSSQLMRVPGG